MGEHITNFNIDELLTSYIDKQITDPHTLEQVEDLIKNDKTVAMKYRSELLTKKLIASRFKQVDLPDKTVQKVRFVLDEMYNTALAGNKTEELHPIASSSSFPEYFRRFMAMPISVGRFAAPRYAYAVFFILVAVSVGLYVNKMNQNAPLNARLMNGSEKNIVKRAINNFHKIMSGDMKTEQVPQNANEIKHYLSQRSDFPVYVPDINEYKLSGILCDEYNGQKICHLVYSNGDDMIYIVQVQSKCIEHKDLEIPDEVRNEIVMNKYFMCDEVDPEDCTLTVWYKDNNVCASVTNLSKQKMNNTFAGFSK